ncbi:MAG TPA: chemotaxis protein CheB [Vicinamibacterales bacterium]|nr:chemotaxis protein CheB [Vicinamibacterales bacterium]
MADNVHDETAAPARGRPHETPPVVGLGASAGGIAALKQFFAHVEHPSGAAYVVILHLSPDHESHLAEVLQRASVMPVEQVLSNVVIQPDHVYVLSPNKKLTIEGGHLSVSDFARPEERRTPVDVFFRTLADSHASSAVAVVLSGTGQNGSAGVKRVKAYGGLVIAQDPSESEYPDMPKNSIATGLVDVVLPVAAMPARIAAYFEHLRRDAIELDEGEAAPDEEEAIREAIVLLRVRTGHDFSNYKVATVRRRIERRMTIREVHSLAAYARLLRQEAAEAMALMQELLISVTSFFRDGAAWQALEERIIPRIFLNKGTAEQVRVWVPGCATGEEAYSVAMLLAEAAAGMNEPPVIQLFATDLDLRAITYARQGLYSIAEVAEVSPERLQRFFVRDQSGYRIRRDLREQVLFAQHNVVKDPPFSHLDLISCRNLLIYLNRIIQQRVIETFHFALRPGGYLFVGTSESPEGAAELFVRADQAAHVYESRLGTTRLAVPASDGPLLVSRPAPLAQARPADRLAPADLHQRLLEQYAPPSVIISADHQVVHMSERVGRYMQIRGGEPSRDLLILVRPELRPDLRTALHQAGRDRTNVDVRGVVAALEDGPGRVDILVRPVLRAGDPAHGFFLVIFDESGAVGDTSPQRLLTSPAEPAFEHLEEELLRLKGQLRTTVEQYETQVEEAKASNEELQAMNEELRSAAEELETGKEELQSVNEELTTVNEELKIKIEELAVTNNDFQNFINATDIGAIFLDRSLRVKFSTPRAREVFNLLDSDGGRLLSDITSRLSYGGVHLDVQDVLERLTPIEREVESDDHHWHLMRLRPYRTTDNRIEGVVITFQDITERYNAEIRLRQSEERLRMLLDSALDYAIFTITEEGIIDSWNPGAERMFGYVADEAVGCHFEMLFTPEDRAADVPAAELAEARRSGRAADERYHLRNNGTRFYCSGVTRRLGGGGKGFAKIARDLTRPREAAEALQSAHDELESRVRRRTEELQAALGEHEAAKVAVTGLLRRLVSAQEDERRRIARDLHDHLGQQLTVLRLALERSQQMHPQPEAAAVEIARAVAVTNQIGRDLDFLAWELRPAVLDELGLAAALPRFVTEWSAHVGVPAEFRSGGYESGMLSRGAEITYYRVAQEALNNVSKHARASRVDVVLAAADNQVVLVVEDDGIGFETTAEELNGRGFGMAGMRERAALVGATLQIESAPGKGTSVYLRRPTNVDDSLGGGRFQPVR